MIDGWKVEELALGEINGGRIVGEALRLDRTVIVVVRDAEGLTGVGVSVAWPAQRNWIYEAALNRAVQSALHQLDLSQRKNAEFQQRLAMKNQEAA